MLKKYWWVIALMVLVLWYVLSGEDTSTKRIAADRTFCDDIAEYREQHGAYNEDEIDWGDFASGIQSQGFDYNKDLRAIMGFMKGYNIALKGWSIGTFKREISDYLKTDLAIDVDRVKVGEYC